MTYSRDEKTIRSFISDTCPVCVVINVARAGKRQRHSGRLGPLASVSPFKAGGRRFTYGRLFARMGSRQRVPLVWHTTTKLSFISSINDGLRWATFSQRSFSGCATPARGQSRSSAKLLLIDDSNSSRRLSRRSFSEAG
jgi:hypothetical protein